MSLISIIMPAYNAEKYIEDAIESVLSQTYSNWELIIVDDGSTDETNKIIKRYVKSDDRIKCLHQINGKQGKARNLGIRNSKGNYIAFLDSDDLWEPEKLSIQISYLIQYPKLDLIFSQGYSLSPNGLIDYDIKVKPRWSNEDLPLFFHGNQVPILSVIVKKQALEYVEFFCEKPELQNVEDYHLWLKLLLNDCVFMSISDRLFKYRIHPDQSTYSNRGTTIAIIHMINVVLDSNNSQMLALLSIRRVKWFLFDVAADKLALIIIERIFKNWFSFRYLFFRIARIIPVMMLRIKIIFHLCP